MSYVLTDWLFVFSATMMALTLGFRLNERSAEVTRLRDLFQKEAPPLPAQIWQMPGSNIWRIQRPFREHNGWRLELWEAEEMRLMSTRHILDVELEKK